MEANHPVCNIKIINDLHVTVPASARFITTYVLQEQGDWFEEEIRFLRTIIKPGMKIIDIGANYGVYTLTFSKLTGNTGKVWAFEPTAETANCLRNSIAENTFTNIELIQAGLSNKTGVAELFTCPNSEWNSLSRPATTETSSETVRLLTLDHCQKEYAWNNLDFLKLDAEGEELNILEAGKIFLDSESPLIMYEFKHNDKVNLSLIDAFRSSGYDSYRYIPGLNILAPFNPRGHVDGFLLNLFACKKDRAIMLESSGAMVTRQNHNAGIPDFEVINEHLNQFPYWETFRENIILEESSAGPYLEILSLYILAMSDSKIASEKFNYLQAALIRLAENLERGEERIERLSTYARIAFAAGERVLGLTLLRIIISKYFNNLNFEIFGPFLPAAARFEIIDPKSDVNAWLFSSVLEQYISMHAYSTYFTQRESLPLLNRLEQLGYIDDEMLRRKRMIESNFPS